MSSESQNRTFPGIRPKTNSEQVSLISKNVKTSSLTVDSNTTLKGNLTVSGFLNVGDGSDLHKIESGTLSVNPGSIGADTRGSISVAVSGLNSLDRVILHPPSGLNAGLIYCGCDVTADNTLTIYLYNKSNAPIDDGVLTWKYTSLYF